MKSNTIYLSFIQVEAMEVEQVGNELQQVFRRSFHVVEIEALPSVNGEPGEQVSISHNGTQGSLEIVGNGKHQLFAGGKQLFGKTIGFFQLTPITVTSRQIMTRKITDSTTAPAAIPEIIVAERCRTAF